MLRWPLYAPHPFVVGDEMRRAPAPGELDGGVGGEHAMSVERAERPVRGALFVQARCDDDVVQYSCLTLERPEDTALDQARGDAVQLIPALHAAMSFEHGFEQVTCRQCVGHC